MRRATFALFTVAAAVSMAAIANAVPFGANNLPPGLENQGGPPGLTNQGGSTGGLGVVSGLTTGGNNPLVVGQSLTTSVSTVPEGSSMILLGAGLFALALFTRRQRSY
jgi:hypothetical protein